LDTLDLSGHDDAISHIRLLVCDKHLLNITEKKLFKSFLTRETRHTNKHHTFNSIIHDPCFRLHDEIKNHTKKDAIFFILSFYIHIKKLDDDSQDLIYGLSESSDYDTDSYFSFDNLLDSLQPCQLFKFHIEPIVLVTVPVEVEVEVEQREVEGEIEVEVEREILKLLGVFLANAFDFYYTFYSSYM